MVLDVRQNADAEFKRQSVKCAAEILKEKVSLYQIKIKLKSFPQSRFVPPKRIMSPLCWWAQKKRSMFPI